MDIVIDTNVMVLYDAPIDPLYRDLFEWLARYGTLTVTQKLAVEYGRTGNGLLLPLLDQLLRQKRLNKIPNSALKAFTDDAHYRYECNADDRWHARAVFLSVRKRLVSEDDKLNRDVNGFRKIDGIQPQACRCPDRDFYCS